MQGCSVHWTMLSRLREQAKHVKVVVSPPLHGPCLVLDGCHYGITCKIGFCPRRSETLLVQALAGALYFSQRDGNFMYLPVGSFCGVVLWEKLHLNQQYSVLAAFYLVNPDVASQECQTWGAQLPSMNLWTPKNLMCWYLLQSYVLEVRACDIYCTLQRLIKYPVVGNACIIHLLLLIFYKHSMIEKNVSNTIS